MCSITPPETANIGSSYNRMRGPGIGCWFSDRSNCSHWSLTLTFTLTSENLSLYTTLFLLLVLIQLCSPSCWHLDSNYCRTTPWVAIQASRCAGRVDRILLVKNPGVSLRPSFENGGREVPPGTIAVLLQDIPGEKESLLIRSPDLVRTVYWISLVGI